MNAAIDMAIGLVLMYLVLSLVCTVFNEFIATFIKLRAKTLQSALVSLIDIPTLRADFYNHGLIDSGNAAIKGKHVSYLSGEAFAMALLGSVDPTKSLPGYPEIEEAIKNLPDSNIRDILLAQLMTATGNINKLRENVATWFDNAMDRVSGAYKRYIKRISLAVGFIIALAVNADSITVAQSLWHDGALRAAIVQTATTIVRDRHDGNEGNNNAVTVPAVVQSIKEAEADLRPLPMGWNFSTVKWTWTFWVFKFSGLVITAAALSLGAPFWFDILSKFINLRGAGAKPAPTQKT